MKNKKVFFSVLFSMFLIFGLILPVSVIGASTAVPLLDDHSIVRPTTNSSALASPMALNTSQGYVTPMVAASQGHIVGIKTDGTVVAVGDNSGGQCNVADWTDITQIAAGGYYSGGHTVGVKTDGTVVAVGANDIGQCNVGGWTNVTQVATGYRHTVGVKSDGTVVAVGWNVYGQCNVSGWTNITQVATYSHTVGLKTDGTVVAVGYNEDGQCDVDSLTDIVQVAAGGGHTVGLKSDGTVIAVGANWAGECDVGGWTDIIQVAAGGSHTVGLKSDGTAIAVGYNYYGNCNVESWTNIVQIAAGYSYTVGLKADGTVVIVGEHYYGQCDVDGWTDIIQVAESWDHTVGLKNDGTVVAVGCNRHGECNVGEWTDITQVVAGGSGWDYTVGLKSDGTVVATGWNDNGECDVGNWTNITQIAAGVWHTVGLKNDGTVVAVGWNDNDHNRGQLNVSDWTDIVKVAAGAFTTVGLKYDGTVVAVGESAYTGVDDWTGIVQVAAGYVHTVGLKSDGTVVAVGENYRGQCNVDGWMDIVQVAAGFGYTLGLKSDGTVVLAGSNDRGQSNISGWTDIEQVAAGCYHTVGLKSDGTVVAVGTETEIAKILLLIKASLHSPAEIRIYDSEGHVTGVINGEVRDEILWATYNQDDESITTLYGFDTYSYEVEGVSSGSYGLTFDVGNEGQTTTFGVIDIPITPSAIHRYHIDWYALYRGEPGITVEKDYDGDGEVDEVIITGIPMPTNPSPIDDATEVPLNQKLSWVVNDSGTVTYDVYFGTDMNSPLVSEGQGETTYAPTLSPNTTYYWRVTALNQYNEYSVFAAGALWKFTTGETIPPSSLCFIATAAYGTPMAEEVQILREFRDEYLLTSLVGQALVDFYYKVSPPIAEFITEHPSLKPIVRAGLVPAVAMSAVVVNTTVGEKMVILGLLALVLVVVPIWATRRRDRGTEHD